jgi:hypothetical protein
MSQPLWPNNIKLEVLGLTGPVTSGKTMFGISIAEPSRTLVYDVEKSASSYESLGFVRIDLQDLLVKRHPKGFAPRHIYDVFKADLLSQPPGKWDVIMLDPADDMELGLVDSVKYRASEFGFSSPDTFGNSGGIFWGHVQSEWKYLLVQLASRCQTFVFTTHLRTVWTNGRPTRTMEPKGKKTLWEIPSLYLWLDRSPRKDGSVPIEPSATVLKSRLCEFRRVDGKTQKLPLLPPSIPIATPDEIRRYMVNPPDYQDLKEGERPVIDTMSEEEKLELEAQIAADKKEAAIAQASAEERRAQANESLRQAREILRGEEEAKREEPKTKDAPKEGDGKEPEAQGITEEEALRLAADADAKQLKERLCVSIIERLGLPSNHKLRIADIQKLSRRDFDGYVSRVKGYKGNGTS